MELSEKRQLFELPQPKLEVTGVPDMQRHLSRLRIVHKGLAPVIVVSSPVQYGGNNVKGAGCVERTIQTAFQKVQQLFGSCSCPIKRVISLFNILAINYKDLDESEQIIKSKVAQNNVVHVDETGLRVEGLLR